MAGSSNKPTIEIEGSTTTIRGLLDEVVIKIERRDKGVMVMMPGGQWSALTDAEAQALSEALKK